MKKVSNGIPQEILNLVNTTHISRFKQDINSWRNALEQAEVMKDRSWLYHLYKDIVEDDQVTAAILQRKNGVLLADFEILNNKGDVDEVTTDYFDKIWFKKTLSTILDGIYYGFSLLNLATFEAIPYVNLYPEKHAIRKEAFSGNNEKNLFIYKDTEYEPSLLESYISINDLGLLNKIAPFYIWKKAFGSWAELGDRFGMPYRMVKTDLTDIDKVRNARNMLDNMVGAGWAIIDEADDYTELQRSTISNSSELYDNLIQACNKAISKIIVGQTSTSEEKPYAGSAKVHKSILDDFIQQDKGYVTAIVNDYLIPKLQFYGIIPLNIKFEFTTSDNISFAEKIDAISKLSPYYHIPPEFIKNWTGIDLEDKELIPVTPPAQTKFRELVDFEEIIPGTLNEKVLKGGIIKISAKNKQNKIINYAYSFPESWEDEKINNWLKQRGLWQGQ